MVGIAQVKPATEGMTFEDLEQLYLKEYGPAFMKNFQGTQFCVLKGERGERRGKYTDISFSLLLSISLGNSKEGSEEDNYRSSYAFIEETSEFGLNLPSMELIEVVGNIDTLHSNQVDKYAETGLTAMDS